MLRRRKRARNIVIIVSTILVVENIWLILNTSYIQKGQKENEYDRKEHDEYGRKEHYEYDDDHGDIIGGMQPMMPTPPRFSEDQNWKFPIILADLFGFRCKCELGTQQPAIILIIHSHPMFQERRNAIRNTWGSPEQCQRYRVLIRFVMGRPDTRHDARLLTAEMEQQGDMMVGNFSWGLQVTTLQTFLAIRWVREICPPTPFFVQATDLTFMRLDKLEHLTRSFLKPENLESILGLRVDSRRVTHDCYNVYCSDKKTLDREFYPPFCELPAGFVMPFSLALRDFSELLPKKNYVSLIDIFYGLAAETYQWSIRHDDAFSLDRLKGADDACIMKSKVTALSPFDAEKTYAIWKKISDPNFENDCNRPDDEDDDDSYSVVLDN